MGAGIFTERVTPMLAERLNKALDIFNEHPTAVGCSLKISSALLSRSANIGVTRSVKIPAPNISIISISLLSDTLEKLDVHTA